MLEKLTEYDAVYFSAAVTEAELGKKDVRDVLSSDALKKQTVQPAEPLQHDRRNYSVKFHFLLLTLCVVESMVLPSY